MALQTITTIKIGETIIKNFSDLKIIQEIHNHHTFSLKVRQDVLVEEFKSVMPVSKKLISEEISIEIKAIPDLSDLMIITNPQDYIMQFYGIVTKVKMQKSTVNDVEEMILIKGYSSSIIMDSGAESDSFKKMTLADIVNKVKSDYEIDMEVFPYYKDNLPYTVQYNESDFNFLNRLAMRYGQWFYYNGRIMVFGSPGGSGGTPKLAYGINMKDFRYDIKLTPTLFKTIENDNRKGEHFIDKTANYGKEADGFHLDFIDKSNQVFNKETVIQLNQNGVGGNGRSASEEYTKNKMRSAVSGMMQIKASCEVPGITLGNNVMISGVDPQLESSYRVTKIIHMCDDGGEYENHFTAVNYNGAVFSPRTNPDLIPRCESQSAIVMANNDPDGLSGVTVQMPWQEGKGQTTPFIPMIQPHGGSGKGSHWIPEVGEKVFVDFQAGNAEMPIVVGTISNKNEKSNYATPNNDIKGSRTRSGIENISNDAEGSWKQSTPDGNSLLMDGKGDAILNAVVDATINVGAKKDAPPQAMLKMDNDGIIVLDGKTSITLKVGESSIFITKEKITLSSTIIEVKGSGTAKAVFNGTTVITGSEIDMN
ncbi:phage baseplate assembly protein V [Flavobacterium sp. LS1R49]|uniref:Phage baseplate assembly protein V n=1 Tax=Flavobacterium shii TaxID=2987687 RepID=A0A9X2ZIL3_9FLAO|nr:phage baseplate assembly protein V [Flavobacterium shii]MCV9930472.1 phage baseplate assembly protein V [Flavobacterium shii]